MANVTKKQLEEFYAQLLNQSDNQRSDISKLQYKLIDNELEIKNLMKFNDNFLKNMIEITDALILYKLLKYPDAIFSIANSNEWQHLELPVIVPAKPETEELLFLRHLYSISTKL